MRTVLLGDSHLARVRRDLGRLGPDVVNAAVGGADARDLAGQAHALSIEASDAVVVSIGTNDAMPWKAVALAAFTAALERFVASVRPRRLVLVTSPGVIGARLGLPDDAASTVVADYAAEAATIFRRSGATVLDAAATIAPIGDDAFAADGLHLSGAGYDLLLPAINRTLRD